jgi:nitrate/nitrite transporter NarK
LSAGGVASKLKSADAIDVITPIGALDQAVHIGLEAGEGGVEFASKLQVVTDFLLKRSPGISRGIPGG